MNTTVKYFCQINYDRKSKYKIGLITMYIQGVQIRYVKLDQGDEKHSRYTNKVRTIFQDLLEAA